LQQSVAALQSAWFFAEHPQAEVVGQVAVVVVVFSFLHETITIVINELQKIKNANPLNSFFMFF
jgi:hypothetical protein